MGKLKILRLATESKSFRKSCTHLFATLQLKRRDVAADGRTLPHVTDSLELDVGSRRTGHRKDGGVLMEKPGLVESKWLNINSDELGEIYESPEFYHVSSEISTPTNRLFHAVILAVIQLEDLMLFVLPERPL